MREILFRGKNRNGVWLYGDLRQNANTIETDGIDLGGDTFIEPHEYGETLYSPDYYVVNPDTVGEYTGLTDKNGTRIFEGDIVSCVSAIGTTLKGSVKFGFHQDVAVEDNNNYGWYIEWFLMAPCDGENDKPNIAEWIDYLSVIGNIHDNPDLTA